MLLDEALPRWDKREVHRVATNVPAEDLFRAFDELTWGEVGVFKALMSVRGLGLGRMGSDAIVFDWFASAGFVELARTDSELVVGATQASGRRRRFETPATIEAFHDVTDSGCIKIGFNFVVRDGALVTETRVCSTDARSRRVFAAYWLLIRPFSGLIRRVWLRAIGERAGKAPTRG